MKIRRRNANLCVDQKTSIKDRVTVREIVNRKEFRTTNGISVSTNKIIEPESQNEGKKGNRTKDSTEFVNKSICMGSSGTLIILV